MTSHGVLDDDNGFLRTISPVNPSTVPLLLTPQVSDRAEPCFNFLSLPTVIQDQILELTLVRAEPIKPYYRCGSLKSGPWSIGSEDDFVVTRNVKFDLFFVNKPISARAIAIFYGKNSFSFAEAAVAQDFLSRFLHRINHLHIIMHSGFLYSGGKLTLTQDQLPEDVWHEAHQKSIREGPHTMEQPQECEWGNLFEFIRKNHHNLQFLKIAIDNWRPLVKTELVDREHHWVQFQRIRCVKELAKLTVPHVRVTEVGSRFMNRRERHILELLIQQRQRKPFEVEKG